MATYVFIHGAFQGGWIWKKVATPLRAAGHTVYTPTLDGCAERAKQVRPEINWKTHLEELVDFLFYEDLQKVILVATSAGGLTISYAADLVRERIGHLVYIEALVPLPGEKMADLLTPIPDSGAKWESTKLTYGPAKEFIEGKMLRDLDPETRAWAAKRFTQYPIKATPRVAEDTDFWNKEWAATVINCSQSANPANSHQYRTAEKLKANLLELDTGSHYPMLSHAEKLVEMLLPIAETL